MFKVAIIPSMVSPDIDGGEFKSMRLGEGVSTDPLTVDGPGAPVDVESWGAGVLLPVDAWEDKADQPALVGATESEMPLCDLFLLLLRL